MVTVKKELVSNAKGNKVSYGKGSAKKKYVVIHQTGNTKKGANAKMHSNLQNNGFSASWHETVDDKEAIINFEPEWQCWHAGDGRGPGNLQGYGMEICINSDGNYTQAVENGAQRAAQKLKDFGLGIEGLKQHNDFSGKNCPAQIRAGQEGITWAIFKSKVKGYLTGTKPSTPAKTESSGSKKSVATVVQEVIDGKWGNNPSRETKLKASGYDPKDIQNKVNEKLTGKPASFNSTTKSVDTVAKEVVNGEWGNNPERNAKLSKAGYNADTIQKRVNEMLQGKSSAKPSLKSIDTVAKEIINGKGGWGNNPGREKKLKDAGYDAKAVQSRINQLL